MALFEAKKDYLVDVVKGATKGKLYEIGYGIIAGFTWHKPRGDESLSQVDVDIRVYLDKADTETAEGREYGTHTLRTLRTFLLPRDSPPSVAELYPYVELDIVGEALRARKASAEELSAAERYFIGGGSE